MRRLGQGRGRGAFFTYEALEVGARHTFELTCALQASSRVCSLVVDGVPAHPRSMAIPTAGDIYDMDGGMFGNVGAAAGCLC